MAKDNCKGKKEKVKRVIECSREEDHTKTEVVEPEVNKVPDAESRTTANRIAEPRAAAKHFSICITSYPRTSICWCSIVVFMLCVFAPFPYVPAHVMYP